VNASLRGQRCDRHRPSLCCPSAKTLRVICLRGDLGLRDSTTIGGAPADALPSDGKRANFGHCYDHTAALSGRDCGRPEGSAHRTMRSDRAVTTPDLRGGGAGPRGDRSRGDRFLSDGDAFDSHNPNFHPLSSPASYYIRQIRIVLDIEDGARATCCFCPE